MVVSIKMKYTLFIIVLALIPGIVCAQNADLSLRGRYNANSTGDSVSPGLQTVTYEGYLRLANGGGGSPLTNVTMTLLADNLTKVDDPAYAQLTRSSAHWVYPPNFTITNTAKLVDWTTDTNPTFNVPVTFSRTLNQTTFSQNGYQLVECNVTFWDTTNVAIIWGEVDNYRLDKVNVTVLNDTFKTDLPHTGVMFQNTKAYQFSFQNMSEIIIGHQYSFSIILKIDRIDPTKTVTYKPVCGINLITTIAQKSIVGANQTISIPVSELPPYVHQASASIHESVNWSYWSHYERSALLLENSSSGPGIIQNSRIGVFRPSAHTFYLQNGITTAINWGATTDLPVTGDWNGDGRTDVGVYRPSAHTFYLQNGTTTAINWGATTDLPVTGDWNGDGRTDVGVYRPSAHTFYLQNGTTTAINWGATTDLPVTGDWNGDGKTDVGVYRPSNHMFYLKNGTTTAINWGASTDLPVTGDWNGDGRTDVGIYRPAAHTFYLKNGTTTAINWGISTDLPVTGKW